MADSSQARTVPRWLSVGAAYAWRIVVVAGALYVLGVVFAKLQYIVVPVFGALLLTTLLAPGAAWLRRRRVPALLATWIVFLIMVGVIAGIVAVLIPSVSGEFTQLGHELSQGLKHIEHWLETGPLHISKTQVDSYIKRLQNDLSSNKGTIAKYGLTGATAILQGAAALLLTLVLTFFFVKDGDSITRWMVGLARPGTEADLRAVGREAWATLSGYVRGTAANGAVDALLLTIGLLFLHVPLIAPIALLTFVGGFLPLVGAIASGLVAALVALVAKGPLAAAIVVGMTVVIHNVEGYLVGPLVLGRAVKLHPVAVLLSLAIGTVVGGVVGAFLAVPVVAILLAVNEHYRQARAAAALVDPPPPTALRLAEPSPRVEGE